MLSWDALLLLLLLLQASASEQAAADEAPSAHPKSSQADSTTICVLRDMISWHSL